jgi:hypothetical protein
MPKCLLEDGCDMLHEVCNRPPWTVRPADKKAGYSFPVGKKSGAQAAQHSTWKLNAKGSGGQMKMSSLLLHGTYPIFACPSPSVATRINIATLSGHRHLRDGP